MSAYDSANFRPPAPTALVTLRSPTTGATVSNVRMLWDTGADVSLVPGTAIANADFNIDGQYELEAFDGSKSISFAVHLDMQLLGKSFRGQFLVIDGNYGIIGRNILNNLSLRFDGPAQTWTEL
jgi:hypothetical protein